jgi:hypothetical protein
MRTNSLILRVAIATALVWPVLACDNKAGPSGTTTSTQSPQLELKGQATVAPGASAQFTANIRLRDGTRQDVTAHVSWRSGNPAVLGMTDGGLATGAGSGETVVTAVYNAITATTSVIVVPAGTYRVTGAVTEAGTSSGVGGAVVEAIRDGVAVLDTTTDGSGAYRLYGVPSNAQLRISRDGFLTFTRQLTASGHTTQNVALVRSGSVLDLNGRYTLTVSVNGNCQSFGSTPLPMELRRRTYTADVTQNGSDLLVNLSGATFAQNSGGLGDHFRGTTTSNGATFRLTDYWSFYYYGNYPDVAERMSDGTVLVVGGTASTTLSASGLNGTLAGDMSYFGSAFPEYAWLGWCATNSANTMQFSMAK